MDDEKLIELVRKNPVLYDMSHPKYMDPKYKVAMWQSIGTEMNTTGIQCKNRWTNIRDHFRRFMLKRKTKTGQPPEKIKKYKYEDHLQFLLSYTSDRDAVSHQEIEPTVLTEQIITIEAPPLETSDAETSQPLTLPSVTGKISQSSSKVERIQKTVAPPDTPALLMNYILEKNESEKNTLLNHEIDMFLAGIGATMKKLNPYNQHVAKGRIFNIVHELESQELFSQTPFVSPNASPQQSKHCSDTTSPSMSFLNAFPPSPNNVEQMESR